MKNNRLIYAATDAASFYAKTSAEISLALSRYMDAEKPATEEETIEKIRMMISYCNNWMEEVFDGILENGEINP
jgi:hypothetical protein